MVEWQVICLAVERCLVRFPCVSNFFCSNYYFFLYLLGICHIFHRKFYQSILNTTMKQLFNKIRSLHPDFEQSVRGSMISRIRILANEFSTDFSHSDFGTANFRKTNLGIFALKTPLRQMLFYANVSVISCNKSV